VRRIGRRKPGTNPASHPHKNSGQAIVSLPKGDGTYKDCLLGALDSPESKFDYHRLLAELRVNGRRLPAADLPADLTMAELLLQHKLNCEDY
jgi:hypothetical protein